MPYLREFVVEADPAQGRQGEFDFSVNCVVDLYVGSLPKRLDTTPFKKVVLVAGAQMNGKDGLEDLVDVVRLRTPFDFSTYWAAGELERKRQILEFAHGGMAMLCRRFGWHAAPFEAAREAVLAKNFVHRRFWGKAVVSPDRRLKARYFIDFGSDAIRVDAVVMRRSGEQVCRRFITTVKPHWFFIDDTLLPMRWTGSDVVIASTRDGARTWLLRPECMTG